MSEYTHKFSMEDKVLITRTSSSYGYHKGMTGKIGGWAKDGEIMRYGVVFNDNTDAYVHEDHLEKIV